MYRPYKIVCIYIALLPQKPADATTWGSVAGIPPFGAPPASPCQLPVPVRCHIEWRGGGNKPSPTNPNQPVLSHQPVAASRGHVHFFNAPHINNRQQAV
jgi:hypothetical protein